MEPLEFADLPEKALPLIDAAPISRRSMSWIEPQKESPRGFDLGEFGGRREAFERRRQQSAGSGRAAGRVIEPRERQGRAQFEGARLLPPRQSDGGLERLLGARGIGRISPQQDLALYPVDLGIPKMLTLHGGDRLIDDSQGSLRVAGLRHPPGERRG